MTPMLCFLAASMEFGPAPIPAEFEEGGKIFHHKKGADRTEKDARVVIGKWFDGERMQDVEEAVFFTPGLLSRWLGYKAESGTPKEEIESGWKNCSEQLSGKSYALIRLARLGTVDPHDGNIEDTANIEAMESVKFEMKQAGKDWQKINYRVVQDVQDRWPTDVLRDTWDQVASSLVAWPSAPTNNELVSLIRWGRNRRISVLAETPACDPGSKCALKIIEKDRTRTINFKFPKS